MIQERNRIRAFDIRSRIVMPPIATYQSTSDGKVTEKMIRYYSERAANGNVGMIITEHSYISLQGKAKEKQLSVSSNDDIVGLSLLTEEIHKKGVAVMAQLNHAGSAALTSATGMKAVSASNVILPTVPVMGDGIEPKVLSKEEIKKVVCDFAAAAGRAKNAGYDGVEIHSAHAYLLNQFYSPLTNKRTDEYGGSLDNRLRIHREVIRAVRDEVGKDYKIAVRLGGCDYMDGGSTIEDSVYAARVLEEEGVDLIDVSGGMCRYILKDHEEPGYFREMSMAIKNAVKIPVLLTGGVKTMDDAKALLEAGAADLIGVGRELLKDAKWEVE